ncbi:hypothetical protein RCH22_000317 [Cryobacterium psychrotolerans]|nr:hypothetical protein [Cryobacterium psychrotolerans]
MLAREQVLHGLVLEYATTGFGYCVDGELSMFAEGRDGGLFYDVVDLLLGEVSVFGERLLCSLNE